MPSELDKSRLAVADEVKFDMFATIPELCDHAKQYKAISRNFACEWSTPPNYNGISYPRSVADTVTGKIGPHGCDLSRNVNACFSPN
jgi:hypothetical protein